MTWCLAHLFAPPPPFPTEQPITSVVITIPPFFNQAARRALLLAAEIANINVLRLMSSPLAASLNFGVFRRKEFTATERNIAIYDLGSSCTHAVVASEL